MHPVDTYDDAMTNDLTYADGLRDGYEWEMAQEYGGTIPLPVDEPGVEYADGFAHGRENRRSEWATHTDTRCPVCENYPVPSECEACGGTQR